MSTIIKAALDNKRHQECETKEADSCLIIFFDAEITEAFHVYESLYEQLEKLKKASVDLDSFVACKFKHIEEQYLVFIVKSLVGHFNSPQTHYKTKKNLDCKVIKLEGQLASNEKFDNIVEAQNICKRLQETPPNLLKPQEIIDKVNELFKGTSVDIKIFKKGDLLAKKLNLIHAVGRVGDEAALIVLTYLPLKDKPATALIGKGVSYDSGGLNIKTGSYMSTMKFDMSGCAVALSLLYAMQKNKEQTNLHVLLPVVENLVDKDSYKADDVYISHAGLSVEITNTDAEGRLIMADALSYAAQELKANSLISIATLTGAIGYALGNKYCGVWSTDEQQWANFVEALKKSGECAWRMPLHNCYLKGLKSHVADIANSGKTGAGGSSRAAMFLKEFTHEKPYVHIDIANVAHTENNQYGLAPMMSTLYWYLNK